ncbi:PP2C family protein-serine/threonine phosphatase [Mucisphaera sp.]|uniref:PP2C family protein-serine/threonine phosphatase n=1 Tax=Mucisphaera sp. TaxID=2913024 RepID=UPI003D13A27C
MAESGMLLVVDDGDLDAARVEVKRFLGCWSVDDRPDVAIVGPAALGEVERPSACWLRIHEPEGDGYYEAIDYVEREAVPTMFTRWPERRGFGRIDRAGVVICPPAADPIRAVALLQGLMSQASLLDLLTEEMERIERQQVGLAKQIGMIDEELRMAAQLQREFLPRELPGGDGLSVHVLWKPASYVSGDIYDARRVDEHHVAFFVADAVGHGVPAALLTVYIRQALQHALLPTRVTGRSEPVDPAEALQRLNAELLARQDEQVRFATAVFGLYDTRSRRVRLCRAGHPLPLVIRADGSRVAVEGCDGPLLGVFDEPEFEVSEVELGEGDRLLIYSDGFEMAFPDTAGEANTRYLQAFDEMASEGVEAGLMRLEGKLSAAVGSLHQPDDLTVVCLAA